MLLWWCGKHLKMMCLAPYLCCSMFMKSSRQCCVDVWDVSHIMTLLWLVSTRLWSRLVNTRLASWCPSRGLSWYFDVFLWYKALGLWYISDILSGNTAHHSPQTHSSYTFHHHAIIINKDLTIYEYSLDGSLCFHRMYPDFSALKRVLFISAVGRKTFLFPTLPLTFSFCSW